MKNYKIIESFNGLQFLADKYEKVNIVLPINLTFAISKNKNILLNELKVYEETYLSLIKNYNIPVDEKGKINQSEFIKLDDKTQKVFNDDYARLINIDIDIKIYKISIKDFGNFQPSLKDMDILNFMIQYDE